MLEAKIGKEPASSSILGSIVKDRLPRLGGGYPLALGGVIQENWNRND